MAEVTVRLVKPSDSPRLAEMLYSLWPDSTVEEHARDLEPILGGPPAEGLPTAMFVAEDDHAELIGFVQTGLRSHADGCDPSLAVGFVEGWYVRERWRLRGVGARLIDAAEHWARAMGCREMASDALIDNHGSHRAHEALGFDVVDRCVHYRKRL